MAFCCTLPAFLLPMVQKTHSKAEASSEVEPLVCRGVCLPPKAAILRVPRQAKLVYYSEEESSSKIRLFMLSRLTGAEKCSTVWQK